MLPAFSKRYIHYSHYILDFMISMNQKKLYQIVYFHSLILHTS